MTARPRALVIGEALVDVRRAGGEVSEHAGGSPANVAVGLARLGRSTSLLTDIGDDRYGDLLAAHLHAEGVELGLPRRSGVRTSSAVAEIGPDGAASYLFDLHWAPLPPREPLTAHTVHTGSLATVLAPGADSVLALVEQLAPTATVTYDLNMRPTAMGRREDVLERVQEMARLADVVKASDEDLEFLWPGEPLLEAAQRLLGAGTAAVVVTRGAAGAVCVSADGVASAPGRRVVLADTIGAGDSFCAALIDRLWQLDALGAAGRARLRSLDRAGWTEVLTYATAAASITVSRPGAEPPTRTELDAVTSGVHRGRLEHQLP